MRAPFDLLLVTDRKQVPGDSLVSVVESALAGGVDAVQLREKDLSTRELFGLATQLRDLTSRYKAKLLINDRIDVALAVHADGAHLPGSSFDPREARALLGPSALIGVSTHGLEQVVSAQQAGADYIVFGPVYDTASKRKYGAPLGLNALAQVTAVARVPVIAIGGITAARVPEVRHSGAAGVAMISAIFSAADAHAAAVEIRRSLADEA